VAVDGTARQDAGGSAHAHEAAAILPTLKDGATVCGGCGMEYTDYLYGEMYHP
jgi:hypothetical protein